MATERYNTIINVEYRGSGDVARYVADLQRIAQAMSSAQGMLPLGGVPGAGGPLALPAGTGTPRYNNRFISRERDIEIRQGEFLNALRDRIAAERAATQAALQRAHEDRVAAIASRPGANMVFGAAGNIEVAFEQHGRSIASGLSEMDRQISSLTRELSTLQAQIIDRRGAFSAQKVNARTAEANAGALQAFYQQQRFDTNATTNVLGGDEVLQMIEAGFARAYSQDHMYRALVQGGINAKFAKQMPPETMRALTGGSYEDFRTRGVFRGHGLAPITIPGYTNQASVRAEMEREATDVIHGELERLGAARQAAAPIAIGSRSAADAQRASAERAAEVRRGFELQQTLNRLVQQEIASQQRIAESRALLAQQQAQGIDPVRARNTLRRQDLKFSTEEYYGGLPPELAKARGMAPLGAVVRATHAVDGIVGSLEISAKNGEIAMVQVAEAYRRMGIASQMLATAREAGYEVRHSPVRTQAGEAWARATGDILPVNFEHDQRWWYDPAATRGDMGLKPNQISALQQQYPQLTQQLNDSIRKRAQAELAATASATQAARSADYAFAIPANRLPPRPPLPEAVLRRREEAERAAYEASTGVHPGLGQGARLAQIRAAAEAEMFAAPAGQSLVPHPTLFAQSQDAWPEYERAQQSLNDRIRERIAAEEAATRAALGAGGGGAGAGGRGFGGGGGSGGGGAASGAGAHGNPDDEFNKLVEEIMGSLTRQSRGPSDPVAQAELRVKHAEDNLVLARDRFNNSLTYGFGPEGRKSARDAEAGPVYDSREAAEMDVTRKLGTLIGAQNALNRAIEARTKAEEAAAAAARETTLRETAAADTAARVAHDSSTQRRALPPGAIPPHLQTPTTPPPPPPGPGDLSGMYMVTQDVQRQVENNLRKQGVNALTAPYGYKLTEKTADLRAQESLAAATFRVKDAMDVRARVLNTVYPTMKERDEAYANSAGMLSRAYRDHANAQRRVANLAQSQAHAEEAARSVAPTGYRGGTYRIGFWQPQWGRYEPTGYPYGLQYGGGSGGRGGSGGGGGYGGWGQAGMNARGSGAGGLYGFMEGFRGNPDRSMMEMLGQTARFSVMYGAMYKILFALTQTLQATLQEGIAWQQAMTDLRIATGRTDDSLTEMSQVVSRASVEAGFAPSQGAEIAARAMGLYGVTDAGASQQDQVARISAQVVSRMAVGGKADPVALQQNIAAIVQALGMDATGQARIADIDAYMAKKFGVDQGAALDALAQSASVGVAAGFSHEELAAIAADMMSRTGQTSSAVGGFMAQIFSRGGEGSLVDVARRQGIDETLPLHDIIQQLSEIYKTASPQEQARISAAFGRGKIQNAAVALLGDYAEVQRRSGQAASGDALGMADKTFRERMRNLGGELAVLGGQFKEFASLLGQSGILDFLGLAAIGLESFLDAVNGLLGVWNQLGNLTQDLLIGFGALLLAIRTETVQRMLATRGGAIGAVGRGVVGTGPPIVMGAAGVQAAGAATMFKGAGLLLKSLLLNPITIAVGGLLALGSIASSARKMNQALEASAKDLSQGLGVDATAADFRNRASQLVLSADEARKSVPWYQRMLPGPATLQEKLANVSEAEAHRLTRVANEMDALENQLSQRMKWSYGGDGTQGPLIDIEAFTKDDLSTAFDRMTAAGGNAHNELNNLTRALYGLGDAAEKAAFNPNLFSDKLGRDLAGIAATAAGKVELDRTVGGGKGGALVTDFDATPYVEAALTGGKAARRLKGALRKFGVEKLSDIDDETAGGIAGIVAGGIAEQVPGLSPEEQKRLRAAIVRAIKARLLRQSAGARAMADPNRRLTAEEATAAAQAEVEKNSAVQDGFQDSDWKNKQRMARRLIRELKHIQNRTDEPNPYIADQITVARRTLAKAEFQEFEGLRKVAQQLAKNKREARQIGHRMLKTEVNSAIKRNDADLLVEIIQQAGVGARAMVKAAIDSARKVAQAAVAEARANLQALGLGIGVVMDPLNQDPDFADAFKPPGAVKEDEKRTRAAKRANRKLTEAQKEIKRIDEMWRALFTTPSADKAGNVYTGSDVGPEGDKAAAEKDKETAAEREAARAEAYASKSEGSMDAARASIASAQAAIAKADKNSVDYWSAMGQLFQAQNALAQAQRDYSKNLALLGIDITNPLQEARVETQAAARKLREDAAAGKAPDVIAQDKVDLKRAQANEEATAFQQRLNAVQTADELGRISHTKYINYLEREKRRLERIKNRTFQQQEQLDQIDRALKSAADSMQAQWNFGSIKVPTPYQVRRYIQEQSGTRAASQVARSSHERATTTNTYTFQIDGADTAKVKQIIERTLGSATRVRTVQTRRR